MKQPNIHDYQDPVRFLSDRIEFLRLSEKHFSIRRSCKPLQRCSPALISNIIAGKRRITIDRIADLAKLLKLSSFERKQFEVLVSGDSPEGPQLLEKPPRSKKTSSFLLSDWINPFVKDALRLDSVKSNLSNLYRELSALATQKRIDKSLRFLLANGYICKTESGKLVEAEIVHVVDDSEADQKIRQFHRQTLELAKRGMETFSSNERMAQAMILSLDDESFEALLELIKKFSTELQEFSEQYHDRDSRLYQLILHLTPTGGTQ